MSEANNRGFSLFEVFDSYDQDLHLVYCALFDEHEEIKEDLDVEPFWSDLVFIQMVRIRRDYRKTTAAVEAIETAISLLGPQAIVVAPRESDEYYGLQLTVEQWKKLGFRRLPGRPFAVREAAKQNPYETAEE